MASRRLRVLITGEILANRSTGVEHYLRRLVAALAQRGDVEVTVMIPHESVGRGLPQECRTLVRPPPGGVNVFGYWLFPPKGLEDFEILHCPTVRVPFLRKPPGPKFVMTVHDLVPLVVPQHHTWTYRVYFRAVLPRLISQCDGVIADSVSTANDVHRLLVPVRERIHVVPLAGRWPVMPVSEIAPKEPYLLAVGTVEPRKNLRRILEAFLQVKSKLPGLPDRLLIAGGAGWGKSGIDRILKEHPADVEWLGYVSDERLEELYRRAKGLVYPSLYEGFGLPVLEAMSLGCPVVTSDRSSLPEVAGEAALYVDAEDVGEMAGAMRRLLCEEDLREALSVKGLRQAERFSWERCAEETVAVYRQVLGGAPSPAPLNDLGGSRETALPAAAPDGG